MAKEKYGNLDELMAGSESDELEESLPTNRRVKRPSPALAVMTGDDRPTSITDTLKADKKAAEQALQEVRLQLENERDEFALKLEEARSHGGNGNPVILTMPVTKQEVTFELRSVNPELIDVSPENERIQNFLDEISLQDILPSIRKSGQQKPGVLRPKDNGRFELIEGSRRLASVKLDDQNFLALVGDVPDEDVRELSVIENKHKDVSPYEKAIAYQKQIENGEFENWTQLGAAKGISSSHISRYKLCVELDEIFIMILPTPSDMPLAYGEVIAKLKKTSEDALYTKANELLDVRNDALNDRHKLLDIDSIMKLLRGAVKSKYEAPKGWNPEKYQSDDSNRKLKHSISNKGTTKFEITGADDEQLAKILAFLTSTLKVEKVDA